MGILSAIAKRSQTLPMPANTVTVCQLAAVPSGEMRCVDLEDRRVLVAHTKSGVFVADEMCTHEDARLCDGNLNGTLVKCPLHGSRFDLVTGAVLDDPASEPLRIYPTRVEQQNVVIELDDQDIHP